MKLKRMSKQSKKIGEEQFFEFLIYLDFVF